MESAITDAEAASVGVSPGYASEELPPPAAPEVDLEEVVRGAVAVGFNEADAVRAVSAGHTDVDSIVNWILDNPV